MRRSRLVLLLVVLALIAVAVPLARPAWNWINLKEHDTYLGGAHGRGVYSAWRFGKDAGKYHGSYTVYHKDSTRVKISGSFVNGEKDGIWSFWDEEGNMMRQERYVVGKLIGTVASPPWWKR